MDIKNPVAASYRAVCARIRASFAASMSTG